MILRRFTQHIKEQNWFAVGLDVIVVIVGIFLGMQVTEWSSDRNNQLLEREYLSRIITDLDESIKLNKVRIEASENQYKELQKAVEILFEKKLNDNNREIFIGYLKHAMGWDSIRIIDDTIQELNNTGNMALITSTEIRNSINKFQRVNSEYKEIKDSTRIFMIDLHQKWSELVNYSPHSNAFKILTTNDEFVSDLSYYKLLNQLVGMQRVIFATSKSLDDETKILYEALTKYLATIERE